jgi:hypothetical protein
MRHVIVAALVLTGAQPAFAQDLRAEEAAIRALIARENESGIRVPVMRGSVFWSGAYQKPVMDGEKAIERDGPRAVSKRVPGSTRLKLTVNRLAVASSGDMAWEYSTGEQSYELKDGTKGAFTNSHLRVWRKDAGEWKVVAQFSRAHDE